MLRPYVFPCTFPSRAQALLAYDRLHMTDLKRSLRLADGLAMVVGMTVGAGIFRTPGIVAARLGRPGLTFVVWVLGAGLAFLGALCFAELTTRQPRAAGKYAFVREAFGTRAGFVVGWVEALGTNGVAIAAIGVAAGEFLVLLLGWPPPRFSISRSTPRSSGCCHSSGSRRRTSWPRTSWTRSSERGVARSWPGWPCWWCSRP